jgi:trigger factor
LNIQLDKKSTTEASIKITLEEADYQPKVDQKIKEYSKKAQIKGFRPGKVPAGLVKKMYGKGILVEEVNHALNHALQNYLREEKIKTLGEPMPNRDSEQDIDWDTQKEFSFTFDIGMAGDFKVEADKVTATKYEIEVDDKTVDEAVENLRMQQGIAKSTNPEQAEKDDAVYGSFTTENSEIKGTGVISPTDLTEENKDLIAGLKPGEELNVEPADFKSQGIMIQALGLSQEEAEAIEGDISLKVEKINRKEPADLNQEMFDKVFGPDSVKSEEEFRNKIKETIAENYVRESGMLVNQDIREQLLSSIDIELPDEFLKRWLTATNEKLTEQDIENEYHLFAKDLRWTLIQNEIAEENEVKVEQKEILEDAKEGIRAQFRQYGMGDEMEDNLDAYANNYLQGNEGQNYMRVHNKLRHDKVMNILREKANITTTKVSPEEFQKKAAERNAPVQA